MSLSQWLAITMFRVMDPDYSSKSKDIAIEWMKYYSVDKSILISPLDSDLSSWYRWRYLTFEQVGLICVLWNDIAGFYLANSVNEVKNTCESLTCSVSTPSTKTVWFFNIAPMATFMLVRIAYIVKNPQKISIERMYLFGIPLKLIASQSPRNHSRALVVLNQYFLFSHHLLTRLSLQCLEFLGPKFILKIVAAIGILCFWDCCHV